MIKKSINNKLAAVICFYIFENLALPDIKTINKTERKQNRRKM